LASHEDGETPIAASGIGDEPGPCLIHPPERFAKLDEGVLIQMLMHGQMVQMVPYIIWYPPAVMEKHDQKDRNPSQAVQFRNAGLANPVRR
jgi:hypothetical protein